MFYKHQYFILDTEARKVFDENEKELRLTGNPYRLLVFLCEKKNSNITEIGDHLDWAKDYDENNIRQYRYKINTIIGHDVIEYKNGVYSIVGECITDLLRSDNAELGKIMKKNIKFNIYPGIIPAITASILLLLSFFDWPYGYYVFLKIMITISAIWYLPFLYQLLKNQNFVSKELKFWFSSLIFVAFLFNPIMPIYLYNKLIWNIIDVIAAGFFLGLIIRFKKK